MGKILILQTLRLTNATILWAETGKLQRSDNVKIYPTTEICKMIYHLKNSTYNMLHMDKQYFLLIIISVLVYM